MKIEQQYETRVSYLNNSPHIAQIYTVEPNGEKKFHSEKRYPVPVTGSPGPSI